MPSATVRQVRAIILWKSFDYVNDFWNASRKKCLEITNKHQISDCKMTQIGERRKWEKSDNSRDNCHHPLRAAHTDFGVGGEGVD